MMLAYLDHAASTTVRPAVLEAMMPWLGEHIGNPSGSHRAARRARQAVDDARDAVAALVGFGSGDVVFTSGGTEADNLAVLGVQGATGGDVLVGAIEHHAVLEAAHEIGGRIVPVDHGGRLDLDALAAFLHPGVALLSVMLVNNEVGTVQPLAPVAEALRRHAPDAWLHTDAVQAASWLDLTEAAAPAQLVSLSAHKIGGTKGVGALLVRPDVPLRARAMGGGQERGRRSGTSNVAGIVGLGVAASEVAGHRKETLGRLCHLRERLLDGLEAEVPGCRLTVDAVATGQQSGAPVQVVPGIVNLCIEGTESEALLFLLDQDGVCASAGSSCTSGAVQLSHVLAALGVDPDLGRGALRLSLGWSSTEEDVDAAVRSLSAATRRLREHRA
jgi:cysteine desulfurase